MSSQPIVRASYSTPMLREAVAPTRRIVAEMQVTQVITDARSIVGEHATAQAVYLKQVQKIAETNNPDCTEAVAAIIGLSVNGIVRDVAKFNAAM